MWKCRRRWTFRRMMNTVYNVVFYKGPFAKSGSSWICYMQIFHQLCYSTSYIDGNEVWSSETGSKLYPHVLSLFECHSRSGWRPKKSIYKVFLLFLSKFSTSTHHSTSKMQTPGSKSMYSISRVIVTFNFPLAGQKHRHGSASGVCTYQRPLCYGEEDKQFNILCINRRG